MNDLFYEVSYLQTKLNLKLDGIITANRKVEKARVEEKLKYNTHYKTQGDWRNSSQAPIVEGGRPVERVWNDGRFAAGLDSTLPDYSYLQLGPVTIYQPFYGSQTQVGGSLSSSYGLGIGVGEIDMGVDKRLVMQGVYKPTSKNLPLQRAEEVGNFLNGVSWSAGGCISIICSNRVQTIPKDSSKPITGYEYGIGTGGTGVGGGIGGTQTPSQWLDRINNRK